jgi:hypothetical protein
VKLLSRTPAKRAWGYTGELVHHYYLVLVREFKDVASNIDDEHFSYIDS